MSQKVYVLIHEETQVARIIRDKTQLGFVLEVSSRTILRNDNKLPYKKNGYSVFEAKNGVEKSKRGNMSYKSAVDSTKFKRKP